MKNIQGKKENLLLYNENKVLIYRYIIYSDEYSYESTYDENGNRLTYKNSAGFSTEYTYNEKGKILTYKNSDGDSYEYTYNDKGKTLTYKNSNGYLTEYTYDNNGNELTYKDSAEDKKGFDIPEYTMEELISKIGNFKLIK